MTSPLVSIIIPCHNAAPWLEATLNSAFSQTWLHKEIILVNDGSTDESLFLARRHETRGLIVLSRPTAGGAAAARNLGYQHSTGDYIQYLDADDLLAPNKLECQLGLLRRSSPDAVATCSWARFHADPTEAIFQPDALWGDFTGPDWLVTSWQHHHMMATAAWLTPRSIAEKAGPWDETLYPNPVDDMEYFARIVLAASAVHFCREALVYYRSGLPHSLSRQRSDAAWHSIFTSFHRTADRLLQRETSARVRLAVATALRRLEYESYPRVPCLRRVAAERVHALGGTSLRPDTGPRRRILQRLLGWRLVKRLHDLRSPHA